MLNGLDLFSGYGGCQDALSGLVRPVAYCEIERGAQRILLRRMRKGQINVAPIWDDVSTLRRCDIGEPIDIITGGFPCQDVSSAGMRRGLGGERSGLFFEVVRLIREFRPAYVYLENVPGLLVRGMDRVSAELAAANYDHRAGVLSAYDVGAPHIRERVWIVAADANRRAGRDERETVQRGHAAMGRGQTFSEHDGAEESLADANGLRQPPSSESGNGSWNGAFNGREEMAYPEGFRGFQGRLPRGPSTEYAGPRGDGEHFTSDYWATEPNVGRVAYGLANRSDRIRALGNGWVPQTAREAFERLTGLK